MKKHVLNSSASTFILRRKPSLVTLIQHELKSKPKPLWKSPSHVQLSSLASMVVVKPLSFAQKRRRLGTKTSLAATRVIFTNEKLRSVLQAENSI